MGKKVTTEEFIQKAKAIHGDAYDYSRVNYIKNNINVEIICPKHGSFWQRPSNHIGKGYGCPKCKGEQCGDRCRLTTEQFIEKAREKHGNKYDYSKVEYVNQLIPVTIICPEHGEFMQLPSNHMKGEGCYKCGREVTKKSRKLSVETIIERFKLAHGEYYDYSLITRSYKNMSKVPIICPKHGIFYQLLVNHFHGEGCPICRRSRGEQELKSILETMNINYEEQYRIPCDLKDKTSCYIDFYIPSLNAFIEYNGIQHYQPVERFGGQSIFEKQVERDEYVRRYCKDNNIRLLEINYKENIQEKLNTFIYAER